MNGIKLVFTIAGVVVVSIGAALLYKKKLKKLREEEKDDISVKAPADAERRKVNEIDKCYTDPNNVVLEMAQLIKRDTEWELDRVSISKAFGSRKPVKIDPYPGGLIHVVQEGNELNFLVEIPESEDRRAYPYEGDFVSYFKREFPAIHDKCTNICKPPISGLMGYIIVSFEYKSDKRKTRHYFMKRIPKSMVNGVESITPTKEGVDKTAPGYQNIMMTNAVKYYKKKVKDGEKNIFEDNPDYGMVNLLLEGSILTYEISYLVRSDNCITGISPFDAANLLHYMIGGEMTVESNSNNGNSSSFTYDHALLYRNMFPDVVITEPILDEVDGKFKIRNTITEYTDKEEEEY
jgi:hypothetical protein